MDGMIYIVEIDTTWMVDDVLLDSIKHCTLYVD